MRNNIHKPLLPNSTKKCDTHGLYFSADITNGFKHLNGVSPREVLARLKGSSAARRHDVTIHRFGKFRKQLIAYYRKMNLKVFPHHVISTCLISCCGFDICPRRFTKQVNAMLAVLLLAWQDDSDLLSDTFSDRINSIIPKEKDKKYFMFYITRNFAFKLCCDDSPVSPFVKSVKDGVLAESQYRVLLNLMVEIEVFFLKQGLNRTSAIINVGRLQKDCLTMLPDDSKACPGTNPTPLMQQLSCSPDIRELQSNQYQSNSSATAVSPQW